MYCNRIATLEHSLNQQRYRLDLEFQDKLRGVKARAAEKRQEQISALEINHEREIDVLHQQARTMESRYALEIQNHQRQAQMMEAGHAREIEYHVKQAESLAARYTHEIQGLRQHAEITEARYALDIHNHQQHAETIEARNTQQALTTQNDISAERQEWFKTLKAADDKAQQATARLDSYLLRQPIVQPLQMKGRTPMTLVYSSSQVY